MRRNERWYVTVRPLMNHGRLFFWESYFRAAAPSAEDPAVECG